MAYIREQITLDEIKAEAGEFIWFAYHTCWWTHRGTDLGTLPSGIPCDPRGSVLLSTEADGFFKAAEANPDHYGKHGLTAFVAAHNDNCALEPDGRRWSLRNWQEYNDLLDYQQEVGNQSERQPTQSQQ